MGMDGLESVKTFKVFQVGHVIYRKVIHFVLQCDN